MSQQINWIEDKRTGRLESDSNSRLFYIINRTTELDGVTPLRFKWFRFPYIVLMSLPAEQWFFICGYALTREQAKTKAERFNLKLMKQQIHKITVFPRGQYSGFNY